MQPLRQCDLACSAGKDHSTGQHEPVEMGLDACLEYIAEDELVEVRDSYAILLRLSNEDLTPTTGLYDRGSFVQAIL